MRRLRTRLVLILPAVLVFAVAFSREGQKWL
jgi:hypothetical protein